MQDLFLKIISREIPANIIYENEHTVAFLDIHPNTKGHTLVIPKNYSRNLIDISEQDLYEVIKTVKYLAPIIMESVGAEGFCLGQNNEPVAGQAVFHTHFHIIPRFKDDGLIHWTPGKITPEELSKLEKEIKDNIK